MRRNDREVRDRAEIQHILEVVGVLRLGSTDGDYPYIVPLRYGYVYAGDTLRFYMHGAKGGKKLTLVMSNPHAFVGLDCEVETTRGGDIACAYNANYASSMAHGEVAVARDSEERIKGLKSLVQAQTGRDFETTAQQAAGVAVFRFNTEDYSVKERKKK